MSSGVGTASFYADFAGLTALKKNVKTNDPQAIREAARQFESLFTDMMLKAMREAKLGEGLGDSDQTDFYQDMYDQQLSLQMSQGKGLGLADMLVQQLTRSGAIKAGAAAGPASTAGAPAGEGAASGRSTAAVNRSSGGGGTLGANIRSSQDGSHVPATQRQRISFVQSLEPYAQQAASQLGVSSDVLIAQAALETGWGQHVPSANGSSSNNLFGIKAGAAWSGAAVAAATTEYNQGAATRLNQTFRAYSSVQQGVNDYVTLLQRQPGFQAALGTGEDIAAFATALQRGGYATDPSYVSKLLASTQAVRQVRASGSVSTGVALKSADVASITAGGDSV